MEKSGEGLTCPHTIEDILTVLTDDINSSKNRRTLPEMVLLLVDIDNLERINRWYGRLAGDEILEEVVNLLKTTLEGKNLLARFGGDDFLILLRGCSLKEGKEKARSIIDMIKKYDFIPSDDEHSTGWTSNKVAISVSIGVANYFSFAFSRDEFIGCVVEALSLAQKKMGIFKVFMEEEDWNEE